ncbi:hypothetical protein M0812_21910 [Anaeramoeba flamelloides]|uniref:Uncharacterized protein n=1 Tax=Anaeramoeba flamelloides TaxID=1746091 RepID=A0AAV7YW35_9EUKA|nr:hypothetical protein M0812_21910 [Anaeramoeba flamelloides]
MFRMFGRGNSNQNPKQRFNISSFESLDRLSQTNAIEEFRHYKELKRKFRFMHKHFNQKSDELFEEDEKEKKTKEKERKKRKKKKKAKKRGKKRKKEEAQRKGQKGKD